MLKNLLMATALASSIATTGIAQVGIGIGGTGYAAQNSKLGVNLAFLTRRWYVDFGTNFQGRHGEYLDFCGSECYATGDYSIISANIGLGVGNNRVSVYPTIGFTSTAPIYEDETLWTTHTYGPYDTAAQVGLVVRARVSQTVHLYAGYDRALTSGLPTERAKLGIAFDLAGLAQH